MNLIFFGTPSFAAELFRFLFERKCKIAAVVTQPDRPQGRSLRIAPSAVKETATLLDPSLPILQPEKSSDPQFLEKLSDLEADLYVVAAFGQILPQKLLSLPPLGCINVHASLLPKYRGAAPIQRVLMNGDPETGVSIQKMVYRLDAGDVIAEAKLPLPLEMNYGELQERLCALSKPLLLEVIRRFEAGIPPGVAQDESQATFAPKIQPAEGEIQWNRSARSLHNLVRALSPKPGAWCWIELGGERKKLKILRTALLDEPTPQKGRCIIAAQNGALELLEVQPEGKKAMAASDWLRGISTPFTI